MHNATAQRPGSKETDMTQLDGTDIDTAQSPVHEAPTFDPRSAFAWTLRSAEIARREQRRLRSQTARLTSGHELGRTPERRYETPTFDPRSAFARTLRSAEIARLERGQRPAASTQPADLLRAA